MTTNPATTAQDFAQTLRECAHLEVGDDPYGRGEPTLFYTHPGHGHCYVWVCHLNDEERRIAGIEPA